MRPIGARSPRARSRSSRPRISRTETVARWCGIRGGTSGRSRRTQAASTRRSDPGYAARMRIEASRPHMPNYGLLGPSEGRGLLPWSWAEQRLRDGRNYWLSTVSAAGRPHAMAVWGVWHADAFFFSTDGDSRKAHNLRRDPRCTLTSEGAAEALIVEGTAREVSDAALLGKVAAQYTAKYTMGYPTDSSVYRVEPEVVFGFIEDASEFAGSATRWRMVR